MTTDASAETPRTSDSGRPVVPNRRPFRAAPDEDDDPVVSTPRRAAAPAPAATIPGPRAQPPSRSAATPRQRRAHEFTVPEELPVAVRRRPRGVHTIAVNFKLLPEFKQVLEDVAASTGATQTEVLESAILFAYGSKPKPR